MLIKPYAQDIWFRLPKFHNPDKDIEDYQEQKGNFSLNTNIAFNEHLNRLNYWNNQFKSLNEQKIKLIIAQESLWY